MRFVCFETTPNPNALKCVVEAPDAAGPVRSYFSAEQADEARDGLARSLFAIPGVTNVLIHTAFVTVGKAPEAKWPAIKKRVRAAIESSDAEADDPGAGADV
jgi:hypothetical protein